MKYILYETTTILFEDCTDRKATAREIPPGVTCVSLFLTQRAVGY